VDGAIRFSFSLGSNITTTVATLPHRVSDGNWHSVTVQYFNKVKVTFQPFFTNYNTSGLTIFHFNFKFVKYHTWEKRNKYAVAWVCLKASDHLEGLGIAGR